MSAPQELFFVRAEPPQHAPEPRCCPECLEQIEWDGCGCGTPQDKQVAALRADPRVESVMVAPARISHGRRIRAAWIVTLASGWSNGDDDFTPSHSLRGHSLDNLEYCIRLAKPCRCNRCNGGAS
jgi:hypothetical protein